MKRVVQNSCSSEVKQGTNRIDELEQLTIGEMEDLKAECLNEKTGQHQELNICWG